MFMSDEEIMSALRGMEHDPALITESAYRANTQKWPGNRISFVDCHMMYLKTHPGINPKHYLANLRLQLRKKP